MHFFLSLDSSKLLKFQKTLQTWKLLLVTSVLGQMFERKQCTPKANGTMHKLTAGLQLNGFLCIAVTFKLLVKGQNLLGRQWHSNSLFLLWDQMLVSADDHPQNLLITYRINKEEVQRTYISFYLQDKTVLIHFCIQFQWKKKKNN